MTPTQRRELTQEEEQLLEQALPIARRIARLEGRRAACVVECDELESVAAAAALDAVRRYQSERSRFAPFVAQRIRWALSTFVRRRKRRLDPRGGLPLGIALRFAEAGMRAICAFAAASVPLPEARGAVGTIAPAGDLANIAMCPRANPEQRLESARAHHALRGALDDLDEPARTLLRRHYFEGERLDVVAGRLGISKHRAYRVHRDAMRALRRRLARAGVKP